jgi:NADPH-dependent 2,4-dienoyl-CoA reductase/sulfur reductase-like enzyme
MNNELVIIGAGPAGLSAAKEAAALGVKVAIIDENDRPGGQLFTQTHKFFGSKEHSAGIRGFQIGESLLEDIKKLDVEVLLNSTAYGIFPDKTIMFSAANEKIQKINAQNIIIATGGLEKPVMFRGWTLPGVMGAGAAQTMMNVFRVLPGKRALMIGTGNVGLIVSYQLKQAGCEVVGLIDIIPKISGYKVHASKIRRAAIPILTSHTIKEAKGSGYVESAVITKVDSSCRHIDSEQFEVECDLICIAAGLQPFNELCWALKMEMKYIGALGGFVPVHDNNMETSIKDIFIAGDLAGIEEASTAMEEGKLAGIASARKLGYISEKEFKQKTGEINIRLNQLRLGSFGIAREKAKQELLNSCSL